MSLTPSVSIFLLFFVGNIIYQISYGPKIGILEFIPSRATRSVLRCLSQIAPLPFQCLCLWSDIPFRNLFYDYTESKQVNGNLEFHKFSYESVLVMVLEVPT